MDFGISIGGVNPLDPFGDKAHDRAKTAAKDAFKRSRLARKTEYQDKVYSLEKAGLNRILAAGGAPTPANAPMAQTEGPKGEAKASQLEAANVDLMQATAKKEHQLNTNLKKTEKLINQQIEGVRQDNRGKKRDQDWLDGNPNAYGVKKILESIGPLSGAVLGGAAGFLGSGARKIMDSKKNKYQGGGAKHYRGLDKM